MGIASWIFGPQLMGILLFTLGLITLWFPPKHINKYYGYRLPLAMKNQQTWNAANRYATRYMLKSGLWLFFIGMAITLLLRILPMPYRIEEGMTILLFIFSGTIPMILSIVATERYLSKTFDNKQ
ncbi:MAG TPA: SdpI family protein [Mucilaginibacter sp.]|jgi:uncharacterized membrane protein|nr:SdpI family protein [Mucilaginibacter sp.]